MSEAIIAAICTGIAALFVAAGTFITNIIKAKKEETKDTTLQNTHEETLIKLSQGNFNSSLEMLNSIEELSSQFREFSTSQKEINLTLLRRAFLDIYFRYEKGKELPEDQFESALNIYTVYKSMGGNGYIEELKNELVNWRRV